MQTNKGFTLIELLVVVLIIGILAAVALPQYQKAVEKSKATQAMSLLKSVAQAYEAHYVASGEYATSFDELALDIPWTGTTACGFPSTTDNRSNAEWSIGIQKTDSGYINLHICRISGKYQGAGFIWRMETIQEGALTHGLLCFERTSGADFLIDETLPAGAYCVKLFSGTTTPGSAGRYYTLPQ